MMIRFDLVRKKYTSMALATVMATGLMVSVPQVSLASDWMDLLKPLVKDVIVPGASMGMKKFIQHQEKLHPELAKFSGNNSSSSTSTTSSSMDDFFNNTGSSSSSSTSSTGNEFSSPEEPISTSNAGSSAGASVWEATASAAATDPAPPPPPPVATP
jgi:hypothetical protein